MTGETSASEIKTEISRNNFKKNYNINSKIYYTAKLKTTADSWLSYTYLQRCKISSRPWATTVLLASPDLNLKIPAEINLKYKPNTWKPYKINFTNPKLKKDEN